MLFQFVRTGTVSLVKNSWSLSLASLGLAKAATWVVFSTATILFMPVMIESERLQLQDAQKAQKNSILLGPGTSSAHHILPLLLPSLTHSLLPAPRRGPERRPLPGPSPHLALPVLPPAEAPGLHV